MYTEVKKKFISGVYDTSKYWRDYKYLQDETAVLKNPHKGWYWHYIDNGCSRVENIKGTICFPYKDREDQFDIDNFAGLYHLYLRIDWSDIEIKEGECDWSYIDSIIDKYGKKGYRFTFRVCTYEGILHDDFGYATPKWVRDAGAEGFDEPNGAWQPKYDDPIFLEKLENFYKKFGEKYNNNPLVEYIDIGTIGIWGEGNCGHQIYDLEMYKKHVNIHVKYFPDKFILVNDDLINCSAYNSGVNPYDLLEYCYGLGIGIRDDSILWVGTTTGDCGYDTIRTPFMFDRIAENAPVDIELDHMKSIKDYEYKEGFPIYEALRRSHATYCGFHGYPKDWVEKFPYLTEHLANKLGYWYFINGAYIHEMVSGLKSVIDFCFENKGFSKAYNSYDFKVKLVSNEGEEYPVFDKAGLNLNWLSESIKTESVVIDLKNVPSGEYTLCVGMFEGETPVKFGFKKECLTTDGYYEIDSVVVK